MLNKFKSRVLLAITSQGKAKLSNIQKNYGKKQMAKKMLLKLSHHEEEEKVGTKIC